MTRKDYSHRDTRRGKHSGSLQLADALNDLIPWGNDLDRYALMFRAMPTLVGLLETL
jgi:hypothetical protein